MATTHIGPGPAPQAWRPRKIEQDYVNVSEGLHKPATRRATILALKVWEDFLRRRGVDSDAVTIREILAWERELIDSGMTRGRLYQLGFVRSYYLLRGSANPDTKWSKLAAELQTHRMPKAIGKANPHRPYPLELLPKILEASRHVKQYRPGKGGSEIYSEAYAFTATLLYTGGRAQWYGLKVDQVEAALKEKYVETFVKEGEYVYVPVPDQLLTIWTEHLEKRDFDGPFLFRRGKDPYSYQTGSKDWKSDIRSAVMNEAHAKRILNGKQDATHKNRDTVEIRLKEIYGIGEPLAAHRFRKSVGTYMEAYGFTEAERRLQLSHGAKSITAHYSMPQIRDVQRKISMMDLGNAAWVEAHNPPSNLFDGKGNGKANESAIVEELRRELAAEKERNERLERKLDALIARLEPRSVA